MCSNINYWLHDVTSTIPWVFSRCVDKDTSIDIYTRLVMQWIQKSDVYVKGTGRCSCSGCTFQKKSRNRYCYLLQLFWLLLITPRVTTYITSHYYSAFTTCYFQKYILLPVTAILITTYYYTYYYLFLRTLLLITTWLLLPVTSKNIYYYLLLLFWLLLITTYITT